jgi:hypothetical protein
VEDLRADIVANLHLSLLLDSHTIYNSSCGYRRGSLFGYQIVISLEEGHIVVSSLWASQEGVEFHPFVVRGGFIMQIVL